MLYSIGTHSIQETTLHCFMFYSPLFALTVYLPLISLATPLFSRYFLQHTLTLHSSQFSYRLIFHITQHYPIFSLSTILYTTLFKNSPLFSHNSLLFPHHSPLNGVYFALSILYSHPPPSTLHSHYYPIGLHSRLSSLVTPALSIFHSQLSSLHSPLYFLYSSYSNLQFIFSNL